MDHSRFLFFNPYPLIDLLPTSTNFVHSDSLEEDGPCTEIIASCEQIVNDADFNVLNSEKPLDLREIDNNFILCQNLRKHLVLHLQDNDSFLEAIEKVVKILANDSILIYRTFQFFHVIAKNVKYSDKETSLHKILNTFFSKTIDWQDLEELPILLEKTEKNLFFIQKEWEIILINLVPKFNSEIVNSDCYFSLQNWKNVFHKFNENRGIFQNLFSAYSLLPILQSVTDKIELDKVCYSLNLFPENPLTQFVLFPIDYWQLHQMFYYVTSKNSHELTILWHNYLFISLKSFFLTDPLSLKNEICTKLPQAIFKDKDYYPLKILSQYKEEEVFYSYKRKFSEKTSKNFDNATLSKLIREDFVNFINILLAFENHVTSDEFNREKNESLDLISHALEIIVEKSTSYLKLFIEMNIEGIVPFFDFIDKHSQFFSHENFCLYFLKFVTLLDEQNLKYFEIAIHSGFLKSCHHDIFKKQIIFILQKPIKNCSYNFLKLLVEAQNFIDELTYCEILCNFLKHLDNNIAQQIETKFAGDNFDLLKNLFINISNLTRSYDYIDNLISLAILCKNNNNDSIFLLNFIKIFKFYSYSHTNRNNKLIKFIKNIYLISPEKCFFDYLAFYESVPSKDIKYIVYQINKRELAKAYNSLKTIKSLSEEDYTLIHSALELIPLPKSLKFYNSFKKLDSTIKKSLTDQIIALTKKQKALSKTLIEECITFLQSNYELLEDSQNPLFIFLTSLPFTENFDRIAFIDRLLDNKLDFPKHIASTLLPILVNEYKNRKTNKDKLKKFILFANKHFSKILTSSSQHYFEFFNFAKEVLPKYPFNIDNKRLLLSAQFSDQTEHLFDLLESIELTPGLLNAYESLVKSILYNEKAVLPINRLINLLVKNKIILYLPESIQNQILQSLASIKFSSKIEYFIDHQMIKLSQLQKHVNTQIVKNNGTNYLQQARYIIKFKQWITLEDKKEILSSLLKNVIIQIKTEHDLFIVLDFFSIIYKQINFYTALETITNLLTANDKTFQIDQNYSLLKNSINLQFFCEQSFHLLEEHEAIITYKQASVSNHKFRFVEWSEFREIVFNGSDLADKKNIETIFSFLSVILKLLVSKKDKLLQTFLKREQYCNYLIYLPNDYFALLSKCFEFQEQIELLLDRRLEMIDHYKSINPPFTSKENVLKFDENLFLSYLDTCHIVKEFYFKDILTYLYYLGRISSLHMAILYSQNKLDEGSLVFGKKLAKKLITNKKLFIYALPLLKLFKKPSQLMRYLTLFFESNETIPLHLNEIFFQIFESVTANNDITFEEKVEFYFFYRKSFINYCVEKEEWEQKKISTLIDFIDKLIIKEFTQIFLKKDIHFAITHIKAFIQLSNFSLINFTNLSNFVLSYLHNLDLIIKKEKPSQDLLTEIKNVFFISLKIIFEKKFAEHPINNISVLNNFCTADKLGPFATQIIINFFSVNCLKKLNLTQDTNLKNQLVLFEHTFNLLTYIIYAPILTNKKNIVEWNSLQSLVKINTNQEFEILYFKIKKFLEDYNNHFDITKISLLAPLKNNKEINFSKFLPTFLKEYKRIIDLSHHKNNEFFIQKFIDITVNLLDLAGECLEYSIDKDKIERKDFRDFIDLTESCFAYSVEFLGQKNDEKLERAFFTTLVKYLVFINHNIPAHFNLFLKKISSQQLLFMNSLKVNDCIDLKLDLYFLIISLIAKINIKYQ